MDVIRLILGFLCALSLPARPWSPRTGPCVSNLPLSDALRSVRGCEHATGSSERGLAGRRRSAL